MKRCATCLSRIDRAHELLGHCPHDDGSTRKPRRRRSSTADYVPPSRAHRIPRDEYLASVRVPIEQKRANHRERQARYRARKALRS